ncbi:S26 family signal peptidase [Halonotius terrestris]|uniref:S26 family signal peptidase n=1 Tax=Halonotius terrestris TaxID=2487750 RepID=A0A8J8PDG4_9EURY|nr:S26 family signal peptidase [Halonotius terrestris]TQQ83018.1 S26 family signal peptidase [Halonotius terrestris]
MKPSDLFQYVVAGVIISLILLLLVTQLLGQPAVVFVETGSMAPTLEPNDGYLAVPAIVAGEPEVGDVILFDAQNLGGGGLTTHRVEAITDQGYITKGDANPFTDQSSDEPPVSDGQIRAVALQVGGDMVVIPGLGASVGAVRSVGTLFQETVLQPIGIDTEVTTLSTWAMIAGLILFVYGTVTSSRDRHERSRARGSVFQNAVVVIAVLTLVVIIPVNMTMLLPSGVYQYEILSSESPSDNEQIIEVGGTSDVTYAMRNSGYLPMLVFLEPASDGVTINQPQTYLPRRSTVETSITMQAPDQTGSYLRFVREYRYLVVLPPSLIASLHAVHPVLAIAAINLVVGGLVVAVFIGTVGTDRLRFRSRNRELDLGDEIRRMLPAVLLPNTRSGPKPSDGKRGSTGRSARSRSKREKASPPARTDNPGRSTDGPQPTGSPTGGNVSGADLLSEADRADVREQLQKPPAAAGIDADSWTPQVLQRYIVATYDTEYPLNRCVKLLGSIRDERTAVSETETASAANKPGAAGELDEDELLSETELAEMNQTLKVEPSKLGLEADSWTAETVQAYIVDTYDVEYPIDQCQQLLEGIDGQSVDSDETTGDNEGDDSGFVWGSVDDDEFTTSDADSSADETEQAATDSDPLDVDTDPAESESTAATTNTDTSQESSDSWDDETVTDDTDWDDETATDDSDWGGNAFTEPDLLSDAEFMELHQTLQSSPEAAGREADSWTAEAVKAYITEAYGVEYPMDRCRQLAAEAGGTKGDSA